MTRAVRERGPSPRDEPPAGRAAGGTRDSRPFPREKRGAREGAEVPLRPYRRSNGDLASPAAPCRALCKTITSLIFVSGNANT